MEDKCNHHYDGRKCVKCGKPMPGCEQKVPQYKIRQAIMDMLKPVVEKGDQHE